MPDVVEERQRDQVHQRVSVVAGSTTVDPDRSATADWYSSRARLATTSPSQNSRIANTGWRAATTGADALNCGKLVWTMYSPSTAAAIQPSRRGTRAHRAV